jgi:transposase
MKKKKSVKKHPGGRPTDFKPEYCDMLINHLKNGDSYTTFASVLNVAVSTLYEWEKNFPEFSEAKSIGWPHYQKYWEDHGKTGLYHETFKDNDGMTVSRSINSAVYIYNMKCRFPKDWRDMQEIKAEVKTESAESEKVQELLSWLKSAKDIK